MNRRKFLAHTASGVAALKMASAAGAAQGEAKKAKRAAEGPKESVSPLPARLGTYYEATVPDTLDLAERARLGLNHFTSIISENHDYEMYWGVHGFRYLSKDMLELVGRDGQSQRGGPLWGGAFYDYNPPIMSFWWGVLQACQPKCLEAMAMLRIMSGSRQNLEREAKMVETLASRLGQEGIYWVPKSANKPWLGPEEMRPYAHVHGQGRMMRAMIAWYQYTRDSAWKERVDRMVDGMDRVLVVHKGDYAYFPVGGWMKPDYFHSCYVQGRGWKDTAEPKDEKFGEEASLFGQQGHIPGALANWYLLTGNEQALRLAGELVRFYTRPQFWADFPGGEYPGVVGAEHAHWQGHYHGYVNVLRALLEYAIATNDTKLKNFVREGYEWTRQAGFARIGLVGDAQGCGCGRLIGLATKLTYAGVGDYWEDVDQYIRNQGTEMQFTPEDIPYLKKLGEGKPAPPPTAESTTEGVMDATIGAYSNRYLPFKTGWSLCCSPHGNMGLFYAWDGTLRYADGIAQVNLLLNRASPWIDIDSYLPYEGKVVLRNRAAREVFVRIPLWLEKKAVECRIGSRPVRPPWFGRYLRLEHLRAGDAVTIEFSVEETTEYWTAPPKGEDPNEFLMPFRGGTRYTCKFKANTLIEMAPPLVPGTPLYQDRPPKYRATEAPMRKLTRFVTPFVLKW